MEEPDNYITEGKLSKGLLIIALPIIASNLLQSVLEVVDLYFVGRLGADAIAGVAMSTTLIFVLATFVIGLVTATTAFISRHYGAEEYDQVGTIVEHSLYIGFVFSVILAIIGHFFAKDLLLLMGANDTVATIGGAYLSLLFLGIFTMIELWIVVSSFQSCGNSMTPMLVMVGVNILNMILNPLLIFGFGPVPAYGVPGSALATILSRGLGLVVCLYLLIRYAPHFALPKRWKINYDLVWRHPLGGYPELDPVRPAERYVPGHDDHRCRVRYRCYLRLRHCGAARTDRPDARVCHCNGNGSYCRPEPRGTETRAGRGGRKTLAPALRSHHAPCLALLLLLCRATPLVLRPEWYKRDSSVHPTSMLLPRSISSCRVSIILSFAMNGAGDTKKPMYATLISMVLIQIPLAYILPSWFGFGLNGIWIAIIVGIVLQAVLLYRDVP